MSRLTIIILFISFATINIHAQNNKVEELIAEMENPKAGEGKVTIKHPLKVKQELTKLSAQNDTPTKGQGYRINIYSGSNPKNSKAIAYERAEQIREAFIDVPTYISFKSPNWRLRVGNFSSYEEAHELLRQLRTTFPKFGKELFIVKDEINLLPHRTVESNDKVKNE